MNSSEELSTILPDLKPWTEYDVKISAYNAEGVGPFSSVTKGKTLADGKICVRYHRINFTNTVFIPLSTHALIIIQQCLTCKSSKLQRINFS